MREIGFGQMWPKLQQVEFTTFRFCRKDRDWAVGEVVRVVFKPRSKQRKVLGTAEIVSKEPRFPPPVSEDEAIQDGFLGRGDMAYWIFKTHGDRLLSEPMNKLTLRWIERAGDPAGKGWKG